MFPSPRIGEAERYVSSSPLPELGEGPGVRAYSGRVPNTISHNGELTPKRMFGVLKWWLMW